MNAPYTMQGIPSALVDRFWGFAEPYIKRALDHNAGTIAPEDLQAMCREKDVQLWLISHENRIVGAVTTEIVCYPRRKHARIITMAGSGFEDWKWVADAALMKWAAEAGCDALEAHVRKGFVSKLAVGGYKHLHSVVVKQLPVSNPVSKVAV